MSYPLQVSRTYINPIGNVIASGMYRSYLTQDLANDFPAWMHLRQNPRSVGQQLMASIANHLEGVERDLEKNIRNKFINTAPTDDVDVLYRVSVPSTVNLLDASASGVRCVASLPGCSPSGAGQVWVSEVQSLEDFYYNTVPTGLQVLSSGSYVSTVDGLEWGVSPSGVLDRECKKYDIWKKRHDITWCYSDNKFRKQDSETMEDYETYSYDSGAEILGMKYDKGILWAVKKNGSSYYLSMVSTKTQEPPAVSLDVLAEFDLTGKTDGLEPSGIIIDSDMIVWICDTSKRTIFEVDPRYDYFIFDKINRQIFFREDYRESGVFISNT
jgi:hypothetical protein